MAERDSREGPPVPTHRAYARRCRCHGGPTLVVRSSPLGDPLRGGSLPSLRLPAACDGLVCQLKVAEPFAFVGSDNGAISHLVVTPDRWTVRAYNDTSHLDPRFAVRPEPLI